MTAVNDKTLVIAQFSDSHLFAALDGLHHEVNVLDNLKKVLASIAADPLIDYAIFTGDLTQDHSEQSYINFATAVRSANISIPVFFLAGNHDEPALLAKYLVGNPFVSDNKIDSNYWQVQLINSKSETPAGLISQQTLQALPQLLNNNKHQLLMMHHHPIDVGYFIDQHGLQNKDEFWRVITTANKKRHSPIKAIACGHVHRASVITRENKVTAQSNKLQSNKPQNNKQSSTEAQPSVDLYTCPATSIQFDPCAETVSALAQGPAYRLFYLQQNGTLNSDIVYL
jgi:Icc protein